MLSYISEALHPSQFCHSLPTKSVANIFHPQLDIRFWSVLAYAAVAELIGGGQRLGDIFVDSIFGRLVWTR